MRIEFENSNSQNKELSNTSVGFKRKFKSELETSEMRIYIKEGKSESEPGFFNTRKKVRIEFENSNSQNKELSNTSVGFKRKFKSELETSKIRIYKRKIRVGTRFF